MSRRRSPLVALVGAAVVSLLSVPASGQEDGTTTVASTGITEPATSTPATTADEADGPTTAPGRTSTTGRPTGPTTTDCRPAVDTTEAAREGSTASTSSTSTPSTTPPSGSSSPAAPCEPAPGGSAASTSTTRPGVLATLPVPVPDFEPEPDRPGGPEPPPPGGWPVRPIVFPVLGPVTYYDDWGACRDGCRRFHMGNDLIGVRLQPLLAARDGWITRVIDLHPTAGNGLNLVDDEGWQYRYYHVNNDGPLSDDNTNPPEWRLAPGLGVGSRVRAGQLIAYMGDSGNSEHSVPHLHFEIARPDGTRINPYNSLRAAQDAARCTVIEGLGELADFVPPLDSTALIVDVPTRTGQGVFTLSTDGATFYTGDATVVGSSRFGAKTPACPEQP